MKRDDKINFQELRNKKYVEDLKLNDKQQFDLIYNLFNEKTFEDFYKLIEKKSLLLQLSLEDLQFIEKYYIEIQNSVVGAPEKEPKKGPKEVFPKPKN